MLKLPSITKKKYDKAVVPFGTKKNNFEHLSNIYLDIDKEFRDVLGAYYNKNSKPISPKYLSDPQLSNIKDLNKNKVEFPIIVKGFRSTPFRSSDFFSPKMNKKVRYVSNVGFK